MSDDAFLTVIDALQAAQIPYMVVGSLSVNLYAPPRSTQDADILVHVDPGALQALRPKLEPSLRWEPQLSFETVTSSTRQVLELPRTGYKVELFFLTSDPHDQERFARRVRVPVLGRDMYLPTPEDVLVTKLRWSHLGRRAKDVDDARNLLAVQGDRLDWDYIHRWCDTHGTRALLDDIRRSIPVV